MKSLLRKMLRRVAGQKLSVWHLQGEERTSGAPIRVLYAGERRNKAYLQRLLFRGEFKAEPLGSIFSRKIDTAWRVFAGSSDILVIKTEQEEETLSRGPFFTVPCWLDVKGKTCIERKSSSVKDDLRKIRKYQYTYEVVSDRASFDDFYHNMYLPFTLRRHDEAAMPITYEQMLGKLSRAELLRIKRDGAVVAAAIMLYGENRVHGWKIGIRGADDLLMKQGVLAAIYLFEAQYLAGRGWSHIDYGGTRAFLLDGQFQYKKKWGIVLGKPWKQRFYIRPLRRSAGATAFLAHNPFLHLSEGRYVGAAFVADASQASREDLDRIVKHCLVAGMDSLTIYALQGSWRTNGLVTGRPDVNLRDEDGLWQP